MANLVVFGVSNTLSNTFECALALGHGISHVVLNQPEILRPRTKSVQQRIRQFARVTQPPQLVDIDRFVPQPGEIYALGTTAAGRTALVQTVKARFGIDFATLVHPTAYVSPLARLGEGVFVAALSIVEPGARLGNHVRVGAGVVVAHDTVVEPFCFLQPGCHLAGHVVVGRGTTIGMGANIIQELVIGRGVVVAAGAVVIADVEADVLVAGVPAQVTRRLARTDR